MLSIGELIRNTKKYGWHRVYLDMTPEQFADGFKYFSRKIMEIRHEIVQDFIVDDQNKETLNQLYFYLIGDERCKYELNKGIYLWGSVGCGKTMIMEIILLLIEEFGNKITHTVVSRTLPDLVKEKGIWYFEKKILLIDDVVKESLENDWNKFAFIKLIEMRYNVGSWTFVTSNYSPDRINQVYGLMTFDRLLSMTNIVELKGKTKRK